jgi:hypothetical protein
MIHKQPVKGATTSHIFINFQIHASGYEQGDEESRNLHGHNKDVEDLQCMARSEHGFNDF